MKQTLVQTKHLQQALPDLDKLNIESKMQL